MRPFLIFALVCFTIDFGYSQPKDLIFIPHLKENRKVDSLIDIIANSEPQIFRNGVKLNTEYFLTGIWIKKNDNNFYLSLYINSAEAANKFTNRVKRHEGNLGCFRYKGIYVILWTPDKFVDLFVNTGEYKMFPALYKLNGRDLSDDSLPGKSWHYLYKNKRFIKESN